jgi:4'-phosphopantetheinyl transferase EntD
MPTTPYAAELEERVRSACERLAVECDLVRVRAAALDATAAFAHPAEERVVEHAIATRRREFATARRLAHELLGELGHPFAPLLPGKRRAPDWPSGCVGSISHAKEIAIVVLAKRPPLDALGIDVEGSEPLSPELIRAVLTPSEQRTLAAYAGALGDWAKLAFCAKECAYKTWSPALDAVPEFTDVEIDFDPASERFVARLIPRAGMPFESWTLHGAFGRAGERIFAVALAPCRAS